MTPDRFNAGKLPGIRRFEDERNHKGLIAVRCSQCARLPYLLQEGQPYRVDLIGDDDVTIISDCNSEYNYYPLGFGHMLEVFVSHPSDKWIEQLKTEQVEVGFLVEENVNLIVVAYRYGEGKFNVTPYSWHPQSEWFRTVSPPVELASDDDRNFAIAFVDTTGGKYRVVRQMKMSPEFAQQFHRAVQEHIACGEPDWERYRRRTENLGELLYQNKVESVLTARCVLE